MAPPSEPSTIAAPRERVIAIIGNPNVGKSTLFNALTGLRQRTANYAGVTVDAHEGWITTPRGERTRLIDLPGTYSLRPTSADGAIAAELLLGEHGNAPDAIVVVLDATRLRRNMLLLTEVMDLGRPVVVVLNMIDEARRAGVDVPSARLRELTGMRVIESVATRGEGVDDLLAAIDEPGEPPARPWRFAQPPLEERLRKSGPGSTWERLQRMHETDTGVRPLELAGRYACLSELIGTTEDHPASATSRSDRADRLLLHPIAGPLFFLVIMAVLFQSIFSWAGPLMDLIDGGFGALGGWAGEALPPIVGELPTSLVQDGIIAGVGSVVIFLPQILILFLFIGLLEDTGYMARAAFLVDRPLRFFGLSGRSFIPLLSGFACAIPGVMAARTIPSRKERLLAILVTPLMTCSARLPVYAILIAAFIPATPVLGWLGLQGLTLLGLYLVGMLAAALVAGLASRAASRGARGRELPLVVELPPYRLPSIRNVLVKLRVRGGDFLRRAGTVIFVISVVLWVLGTFPRIDEDPALTAEQNKAAQLEQSFAGRLGHAIEPAIAPLGYDWKIGIGVIASFGAREVFVSTMGITYSLGEDVDEGSEGLQAALKGAKHRDGRPVYSLATVFSLLIFYVFALQCGATVAIVKRETASWRFAIGQLVLLTGMAYFGALITYQVLSRALA